MRRTLLTILAGATALALAACSGGDDGGSANGSGNDSGPDEVTVGVIPIVDVAPIHLGVEQGFFSDRDIEVSLESGQGGAAIVPGVVSDQFQFGFSNVTSLILARSQGLPLQVVAAGNSSTGEPGADFSGVVVAGNNPAQSAADLAGGSVAVNTLNNIGDTTVRQSVEKAGGDPSSIQFVELPFPDMPAAVSEGRVDAAWLVEPFLTIAKQQGARELASNLVDTDPGLMISAYFTSEKLAQSDPDLVERFTEAMNESLDYAADNPDEVRRILGTYTQIDPSVAEALVLPQFTSEINAESTQRLADLAAEDGLIEEKVDVSEMLP